MSLKSRRFWDGVAIVWLLIWGYLTTIGGGLITFPGSYWFWLSSPILLVPSVAWLGWSIWQKEGHGPARITMESTAFMAGVIMLVMQYPPIAEALSHLLK